MGIKTSGEGMNVLPQQTWVTELNARMQHGHHGIHEYYGDSVCWSQLETDSRPRGGEDLTVCCPKACWPQACEGLDSPRSVTPISRPKGNVGDPTPSRRAKSNGTILVAFRKRHSTAKIVTSFSSF